MIIRAGNISMQRFLPEHTGMLYRLINNPDVRKGMRNSAEIPYKSHLLWVKKNLLEGDVHLFVVMDEYHGEGVALIKNISGDSGELGVMVADISSARKTLLTSKLLTGILYYFFYKLNLQFLNISILPGNINSLVTAEKIGAEFQGQDETYRYFLLEKAKYESFPLNRSLISRYQPFCVE
jgi:RimJ/RimL family protein N-acetyltransferase